MKTQVFLIDLENVQPDLLPALAVEDVRMLVFVGPNQTRLSITLVEAVQKLGSKAEYVRVSQQGKDALDMYIAFHLGRLCVEMPGAYFHIISKDRDYEPLLMHLNGEGAHKVARWPDLVSIPMLQRMRANTVPEQALAAIRWLAERPKNRPATLKTLRSTLLKSVFAERLDESAIDAVVKLLQTRKVLALDGQKVRYLAELEALHG